MNNSKSSATCALVIVTMFANITVTAQAADEPSQRIFVANPTMYKHTGLGVGKILEQYGSKIRTSATLEACGLESLAQTLMPTDEQVARTIEAYVDSNPDAAFVLTTNFTASVMAALALYRIGFVEATKAQFNIVEPEMRDVACAQVTKLADKLLSSG